MLRVQKNQCATCVYKEGSPVDPGPLEDAIRTKYGDFHSFRVCHSSENACCAGFWEKHKDHFQMGQLAQRLDMVEWVQDKESTRLSKEVAVMWKMRQK